jgi:hypothetical protein
VAPSARAVRAVLPPRERLAGGGTVRSRRCDDRTLKNRVRRGLVAQGDRAQSTKIVPPHLSPALGKSKGVGLFAILRGGKVEPLRTSAGSALSSHDACPAAARRGRHERRTEPRRPEVRVY